jgi:hypothetical protein
MHTMWTLTEELLVMLPCGARHPEIGVGNAMTIALDLLLTESLVHASTVAITDAAVAGLPGLSPKASIPM